MKKILLIALLWLAPSISYAANVNIDGLPAASSVAGADLLECEQSGVNHKCTATQTAAFIYGLMSGDATASGVGAVTFATVNANVGSFGSATQCTAITVNAKGLITAASASTCTPAVGSITGLGTGIATFLATPSSANLLAALTTSTGTGVNVFGTAPTISSLNATTAMTLAFLTGGGTQCLTVGNTGTVGAQACGGGSSTITAGSTVTSGITSGHFLGASSNLVVDQTAVTSVSTGCGAAGGTITGIGTISAASTLRANTATTDTITSSDGCNVVSENNAASVAVGIAVASTTGFTNGIFFQVCNIGAGVVTITPTTSTIGGASSKAIQGGTATNPSCLAFQSDGTNYNIISLPTPAGLFTVTGALKGSGAGVITQAACADLSNGTASCSTDTTNAANISSGVLAAARGGAGTINGALKGNGSGTVSQAACADLSNGTTLCSTTPGTGVATAAAATLSSAGGLTSTIAAGTSSLGTGAITSATCATVVTTTATNTATTDVVLASFNGDPHAVTGYIPSTSGMLTIIAYPSSNNVNFLVCNNTAGSITPGAITLNWRVVR